MRWGRSRKTVGVVLLVLWIFTILAVFYVVQKPFGPETARAIVRSALDLGAAALVIVFGAALGRRILIWLGLDGLSQSDLLWLAPGLGLGAVGLMTFGLGLAGIWRRWAVYGLVVVCLGLLTRDIVGLARQMGPWRPQLTVGRWGRLYLIVTLALTTMLALAPPTSWDGLFYHLTGPALYIDQTAITPLDINIPHLAFPSLMETLFGLAMLLGSDVAAKLLHLAYGLLLAILVYRFGQRWQGRDVAGWSLLLLVGMPMVSVLAAWAYNDLTLAFYQLGALYALVAWQTSKQWGWLVVAGLLSGLALGLKYTAFPLPLVGLTYLLWQPRKRWRAMASFALLTAAVAAPWYLRNWAFTGNPVYPFLFGGRGWDAFRSARYAEAGTGVGWHPLRLVALPVTMMLGVRDVNYYDGRMGPLFVALAPVLVWFVVRKWRGNPGLTTSTGERHALGLLGGFTSVYAVTWTLGVIQSRSLFQARLFLPGFVALVPLLAESMVRLSALDRREFSISAFVRLAVGVVLALGLINRALDVLRLDPFGFLVGYESRSDYLRRVLGDHYRAMEALEETVPDDGRVLFLWEPRSYYSPRPAEPDAILDKWAHLVHLYGSEVRIAAHLRGEGYTHVLLNQWGLDFIVGKGESRLRAKKVRRLDTFIDQYLSPVETVGTYRIFELQE